MTVRALRLADVLALLAFDLHRCVQKFPPGVAKVARFRQG